MMALFRSFAKSWFASGLIVVLIVAFAIFGVRDVFKGQVSNAVVQAGSRTVTAQQFQRIFERNKEEYEQKNQQAFPLELAVQQGVDKQLLDQLTTETAYDEMLTRSGIRPSDALVATEFRKMAESGNSPQLASLFDAVTGKFNENNLRLFLQQNGMTLDEFQQTLRDGIANAQFTTALQTGFRVPRIYTALEGALATETRDVSYFVIPVSAVPKPAAPTDAQLAALIKQHAEQLMRPERRVLTLVSFSAKALAPTVTVDPNAVQKEFDFRKDSLGKPETRSLVEIPVKTAAAAADVQARLQRGEDPNAVAKSQGVSAVVFTDQPQSAISDQKVGAAAFALPVGQVSGAVQGDLGMAVVKVVKATPGVVPTLESARPEIVAELSQKAAADKAYDLSQKFEDARQSGANIVDAALKVGIVAQTNVGPVAADGQDGSGQKNPLLTDKMLKVAFDLSQGGDSDVEQSDKGEYYAIHVDKVLPPSLPTVDEVRAPLTAYFMRSALVTALKAKADAAVAAMHKGETLAAAAAQNSGQITHQTGMQRLNAQQYQQTLGQEFLGALFDGKQGDLFVAPAQNGVAVAQIDSVRPGDPTTIARMVEGAREQISNAYLEGLVGAVRTASAKQVKVRSNLTLARQAIGVDTATLAKAGVKPGAAPASKGPGLAQ